MIVRHCFRKSHRTCKFIKPLLLVLVILGAGSQIRIPLAQGQPEWFKQVGNYPVGQSDPFDDIVHRLQITRLTSEEVGVIERSFPGWDASPELFAQFFPYCYESLQLKFDPHEYEERGVFVFDKDLVLHSVNPRAQSMGNRTYSIHVDRYADPRYQGKYQGAILVVPGTGSYGGNYVKFALTMASLKGYIVYLVDNLGHGRSHGHKMIQKATDGDGTGLFLERAISPEGKWNLESGFDPGWRELEACAIDMGTSVAVIQAVGRRIAFRERENLKHLNDQVLSLPEEKRSPSWFGKNVNELTHVTLLGTSQGGETAFWSADPRTTGQGGQAAFGIFLPFDSVICHNIYNTAYTAPQPRMRLLRSNFPGNLILDIVDDKDSLWLNADWSKFYGGSALFLRACDRWVRWRYDMVAYRSLLKFGEDHRDTLAQMGLPLLVSLGTNDLLYESDNKARGLVRDLFYRLPRDPAGESLWFLEYQTPAGTNGHQLLVHHTFPFADVVDGWIKYRRGGPGSTYKYPSGLWQRVE